MVSVLITKRMVVAAMLVAVALPLTGCGKSPPAHFRSNLVQMAANNVSAKHQQQIATALLAMFGTPDDPFVLPEASLELQKIEMAAGPVWSNRQGSKRGLFREQCAHCHGITGDALGPTAAFLKPYPRDYRQGLYKFKSTPSNTPPTHDDLVRIVKEGAQGTAMPSFKLLSQAQIESLVEYVKYLSLRGQTELALITYVNQELDPEQDLPADHDFLVVETLQPIVAKWQGAAGQATPIPQPPTDFGTTASVERGRQVYYSTGGCVKCHGPTALGDGQKVFDLWNEAIDKLVKQAPNNADLAYALRVDALPLRLSDPRNLRQGVFRGGRAPFELFYRLHNGVFPSQMPGIAQTPGMTPDDIWRLVDFVLALPYEPGSQYHGEVATPARDRL